MTTPDIHVRTIGTVKKYISSEAAEKYRIKAEALNHKKVTVTNTGVVSSGKSSLYNALLDCNKDDRFPVGAARTTVSKDSELLEEDIELVDTPGIDVKVEDDRAALNAIYASSIVIMVHNIKTGMLHKSEANWLRELASNYKSKSEIRDRVIFVCSWIDERMMDTGYQDVIAESKRIAFESLGTEVDVYCVSAKLYRMGVEKQLQKMIDISGIPELKAAIVNKSKSYSEKYGTSLVKKEIAEMCRKDSDALAAVEQNKKNEAKSKKDSIHTEYLSQYKKWNNVYEKYRRENTKYKELGNQL